MIRTTKEKAIQEGLITALAVGGVFIILGLVAILTPDFTGKAGAFIEDFTNINYIVDSNTFSFPAPAHPAQHTVLFTAALNFILGIGILQIIILPLRLWFKSKISRIAETIGNLVFWIGAAFAANTFLLAGTTNGWFQFWATLIILAGTGLISRFLVLSLKKPERVNLPNI